jgi:hypothetical protein
MLQTYRNSNQEMLDIVGELGLEHNPDVIEIVNAIDEANNYV